MLNPLDNEESKDEFVWPTYTVYPHPSANLNPTYLVGKFPNQELLWYQVKLTTPVTPLNADGNTIWLNEWLHKIFNLPYVSENAESATPVIQRIVQEAESNRREIERGKTGYEFVFNNTYFIAIKGFSLNINQEYELGNAKAKLTFVDPDMIPFLADNNYCNIDSDCMIRHHFCGFGAFNQFDNYVEGWGCETLPYDYETQDKEGNYYLTGQYDSQLGCKVKVEYESAGCVNNSCVGINRKLLCK